MKMSLRPRLLAPLTVAALLAATPGAAGATGAAEAGLTGADRATLHHYAADTWVSMVAMLDPDTALPADNIDGSLAAATRAGYTSPTNIGGYLWSTVAARELGLISRREAARRAEATLASLAELERHPASGQFYNWYDPSTGEVLTQWPEDGSPVTPFLSSVDNGWLAAALLVTGNAIPGLRQQTRALLAGMDFGFYYNPTGRGEDIPAGVLRGGFWDTEPSECGIKDNYRGEGPDVWYTCHHYDVLNSEPRIASYLGIAFGQIPPEHYFATYRTFSDSCDWSWAQQQPVGYHTSYLGVPVFEGAYRHRGIQFVPSWGGDMFESLMPDLFVPEARWAPDSWGRNHPAIVAGQIEHGMNEAGYGYWGFSPASHPSGGYSEWGVDAMGMNSGGYPSDVERTDYDPGFGDCREPGPTPEFGDGVVTPHAVFLALPYAPRPAMDNLARLRADFDAYGPGGFYDAIATGSGTVAQRYLALDQSMIMAALANQLRGDAIKRAFVTPQIAAALRPLLRLEEFNVPENQEVP